MNELEQRIIELEIHVALQEDLLMTLNNTIVQMQNNLDLQQSQLRLLYQKIQQQDEQGQAKPYSLLEEIPPHY